MHQGTNVQITTSDKTFSGTIKLGSIRQHGFYAVGINDVSDTKMRLYAKNISLHKRNKGNLIVDGAITASKIASGSITTDKLAAQAVTAAKINVKDLFAQDITATGTIRGVTLQGAKGEIEKIPKSTQPDCTVWIPAARMRRILALMILIRPTRL